MAASALDKFCETFQIKLHKPAPAAQLAKAETAAGGALPKPLRAFYEASNGGQARGENSALTLSSIKDALDYAAAAGLLESFWGFWPLAENNDSNPVCVCCRSPLAGYVVLVSHDDQPRLMFRSLDGFFRAATSYVAGGEFLDTHELPSPFAGPERTKADATAARKLMALLEDESGLDEATRIDAARFACDLLSDEQLAEMKKLLAIDNESVREHVQQRLERIQSPAARKAAQQAASDFDSFVESCAQLLQKEGIAATVLNMYGKNTIRIDPGPIWLNMDMFFAARKRKDFNEHLLERARTFLDIEHKEARQRK